MADERDGPSPAGTAIRDDRAVSQAIDRGLTRYQAAPDIGETADSSNQWSNTSLIDCAAARHCFASRNVERHDPNAADPVSERFGGTAVATRRSADGRYSATPVDIGRRGDRNAVVGRILRTSALTVSILCNALPSASGQEADDPRFGTAVSDPSDAAARPAVALTRSVGLPALVDLADRFPTAGFQSKSDGPAWALAHAVMSYYVKAGSGSFSPGYVHDLVNRGKPCRRGYSIHEAARVIESAGLVDEGHYPYRTTCADIPGAVLDQGRTGPTIRRLERVLPLATSTVRAQLAKGDPVVVAVDVPMALASGNPGTSIVEAPPKGRVLGIQAMVVVGYDASRRAVKLLNSWGPSWGDRGAAWVSETTFDAYVREGWVVRIDPSRPGAPGPSPKMAAAPVAGPSGSQGAATRPTVPIRDLVEIGCAVPGDDRVDGAARVRGIRIDGIERRRSEAQCDLAEHLSRPLAAGDRPRIGLPDGRVVFHEGDGLTIEVQAPSRPVFLHVAYLQADGSVVHLQQSSPRSLVRLQGAEIRRFGTGVGGSPRFVVQAPFGDELILAIASESPLFDRQRPTMETIEEFATAIAPIVDRENFVGSAEFVALATIARRGPEVAKPTSSPPAASPVPEPPPRPAPTAPPIEQATPAPRPAPPPSGSTAVAVADPQPALPLAPHASSVAEAKPMPGGSDTGAATAGPTMASPPPVGGSTEPSPPVADPRPAASDLPIIPPPEEGLKPGLAQGSPTNEECARIGGRIAARTMGESNRLSKLMVLMSGACELVLPKADGDAAEKARRIVRGLVSPAGTVTRGIGSAGALEVARPSIDLAVTFEVGSARLDPEALEVLRALAEALSAPELRGMRIGISGHADATGDPNFNLRLSRQRAATVVDHLVSFWGVPRDRLESTGWGSSRPKDASNPTAEINRRVEVTNLGDR